MATHGMISTRAAHDGDATGAAVTLRLPPDTSEPAIQDWRARRLPVVLAEVRGPAPWVVAVDGRSAGGKTTMADRIVAVVGGAVVHTDDLAWNFSVLDWADGLAEHVVEPVRRGEAVAYRPPGWIEHDRDGAIELPAGLAVLVVEGVGAGRARLAPLLDTIVWVQSDAVDAYRRGIARDVALGRTEKDAREFWEVWAAEERPFLEHDRPWGRADLILAGSAVLPLGPDEVAVASLPSVP